jgi:hypothetical protein
MVERLAHVRKAVDAWAEVRFNAFTSTKVGEFIESTCRADSSQGLHYRISALSNRGYWCVNDAG